MKGIILAGGAGTRLHPLTKIITKQLLPVYDKPMVYYPMSTLVSGGIRDILIISDSLNIDNFKHIFSDGKHLGLNIDYKIQSNPNGIAEALVIGEDFIDGDYVTLILGDNIFHSTTISDTLLQHKLGVSGAVIFAYPVSDPKRYGIVTLDSNGKPKHIIEKPNETDSNLAIVGLYIYDNNVIEIAKNLIPSKRKELEITDVNKNYLERSELKVEQLGRGCAWLDAGTFQSLHQASNYVQTIQERQGKMIGCIEEAVWMSGFISDEQLDKLSILYNKSNYGLYLRSLIDKNMKVQL